MPPTIEFLGVIAVLAQTLSVVQAGETAVGVSVDVVGVPNRRPAPRGAADLIAGEHVRTVSGNNRLVWSQVIS